MANTINVEELNEFNDMVDRITEDIEAGRVTANPLKPETKTINEIEAEELMLAETGTETGEESLTEETISETPNIAYFPPSVTGTMVVIGEKEFVICEEPIGTVGKSLIVVSNENGEVLFGSAAVAAACTGLNPTTVRDRCAKEYIDKDGNTWQYREK